MYVTPTTQTQYVVPNTKTTDANSKEYEASATVTPKDTNENMWINQLSDDINNILSNTSSSSSLSLQSSIIKDEIEGKISQYASALMQENGDTPESELETSKLLNQYKTQLLQEYKASIENSTDNEMSAKQEAIIKVLMEENMQESSALTALLSAKSGTTEQTQTQNNYKSEFYNGMDDNNKVIIDKLAEVTDTRTNPLREQNLPDWVYDKIKESLGVSDNTLFKSQNKTGTLVKSSEDKMFKSGQLAMLTAMVVGNAIALSGGQSDMKINEDNVDWEEVFSVAAKGFKNNMSNEHTNEQADKYEEWLNTPDSQYYSATADAKEKLINQYRENNYKFNSELFNAVNFMIKDFQDSENL